MAALLVAAGAAAAPAPSLDARRVIVRGGADLASSLVAAVRPAIDDPEAAPAVAIVVDVTPNTRAAKKTIAAAIEALGDEVRHLDGAWRIGALGRRLGPARRHPSRLGIDLADVLAEETPEPDTIRALSRSLSDFADAGGIVVYLADWRFEDDDGLEALVDRLAGRRQTFEAIGSEAASGRPWNDPFAGGLALVNGERYVAGIGRSPFGGNPPASPWHGGDTAIPHLPWLFGPTPWFTEFVARTPRAAAGRDGLEDLEARLRRMREEKSGMTYPLASSWGPYGLMRLAAATGGHYRLHSFNPSGRTDVVYDYSRCNRFPPDLRPRSEIRADLGRRPLFAASMKAWDEIADATVALARITSPLAPAGSPREMEWADAPGPSLGWITRDQHREFLRIAAAWIERADGALAVLDAALAAPPPASDPDARWWADAALFRQTLATVRFELAEAVAVARDLPADAFDDDSVWLTLVPVDWIEEGLSCEPVSGVEPRDPAAAKALAAARQVHLDRFAGTPFGEIVARNAVVTFVVERRPKLEANGRPPGRTPSESGAENVPTPPRPAGGSSGGGPGSGR